MGIWEDHAYPLGHSGNISLSIEEVINQFNSEGIRLVSISGIDVLNINNNLVTTFSSDTTFTFSGLFSTIKIGDNVMFTMTSSLDPSTKQWSSWVTFPSNTQVRWTQLNLLWDVEETRSNFLYQNNMFLTKAFCINQQESGKVNSVNKIGLADSSASASSLIAFNANWRHQKTGRYLVRKDEYNIQGLTFSDNSYDEDLQHSFGYEGKGAQSFGFESQVEVFRENTTEVSYTNFQLPQLKTGEYLVAYVQRALTFADFVYGYNGCIIGADPKSTGTWQLTGAAGQHHSIFKPVYTRQNKTYTGTLNPYEIYDISALKGTTQNWTNILDYAEQHGEVPQDLYTKFHKVVTQKTWKLESMLPTYEASASDHFLTYLFPGWNDATDSFTWKNSYCNIKFNLSGEWIDTGQSYNTEIKNPYSNDSFIKESESKGVQTQVGYTATYNVSNMNMLQLPRGIINGWFPLRCYSSNPNQTRPVSILMEYIYYWPMQVDIWKEAHHEWTWSSDKFYFSTGGGSGTHGGGYYNQQNFILRLGTYCTDIDQRFLEWSYLTQDYHYESVRIVIIKFSNPSTSK